jgi:hypothetical protein
VCGTTPCEAAHIRTKKKERVDAEWNVLPLCHQHHMEQHRGGWKKFADRYIEVEMALKKRGWHFEGNFLRRYLEDGHMDNG